FWIDKLPDPERKQSYARLRAGEVIIERVSGESHISGGLIHHWKGLAFFPGVSLAATLQLLQSYNRYQSIYAPTVTAATLKRRSGNTFDILLRIKQKRVLTVVLNTEYTVEYIPLNPKAEFIQSRSIRIAQVENADEAHEREKTVGN